MPAVDVTILFNEPTLPREHPDYVQEAGVLESVDAFRAALESAGHRVSELALSDTIAPLLTLRDNRPDVIVNLCEGLVGQTAAMATIAGLLELTGIPFTGNTAAPLAMEHDKARCKWLLRGAGLPTAPFVWLARGEALPAEPLTAWLAEGPLFVKPASEDASLGISELSVVENWAALERQAAEIAGRYGDVLIERYIDGREFNIAVIALPEPEVLPLAEIDFQVGPGKLRWPIVTYRGKWDVDGPEDLATQACCPADVEPALGRAIAELALAAFRLLGCRDYARVDMRVDRTGNIYLLELNANPDAGPGAGFARALKAAGIPYSQFVERLVATAIARGG
jgi:D-alanine-D-alanine ligase